MQHDALPIVLEALLDVEPGMPEAAHGELQTVPLLWPSPGLVLGAQSGPGPADDAALMWDEQAPAQPQRVTVRNPFPWSVIVDAGTVLQGGMSARAVARTVVVAPGPTVSIGVEPLGARWWDEGPLRVRRRLGAVAAGLLLQAAWGEPSLARSARTALWALPDGGPVPGVADLQADAAPATGWVLILGATWSPHGCPTAAKRVLMVGGHPDGRLPIPEVNLSLHQSLAEWSAAISPRMCGSTWPGSATWWSCRATSVSWIR